MNIQAVIVTFNNAATIEACLNSLKANNIPAIVIDNASTDDTLKKVSQYSDIQLITSATNIGFATAANQAAAQATADVIFFLNPDAAVPQGTDSVIKKALEKNPAAAILGLLLCGVDNQPEIQGFGEKVTPISLFLRKINQSQVPSHIPEVDWVSGGALVIRREVWQRLRGFDPQFFLYWEDVDLCLRAQRAGYKIMLLPEVRVRHQKGGSLTSNAQKTKLYDQSADRYFRKHYAFPIWGILHLGRYLYRLLGYQAK